VVKIFSAIRKEMPAKLLMVGDGPERHAAEDLARELGIEDDIRFLGKQEQMEDILAVSDVFLLPSEYESFGLAALEAMAARTVVISTNAGGLAEINIQGVTGFMSNVGDIASMSTNAINLLTNETALLKMKEAAYEQACLFDISKIIPVYEKLYSRFCRMQLN
jgi:glycosyltransferase involved in cell wall biosynthesis